MTPRFYQSSFIILSAIFCLALLSTFYFLPTFYSFAQSIPTGIGGLVIEPSAENPFPGQEVTISVTSYNIDINSSKVSWVVNGKAIQSGIGITKLKVIAPDLGQTMTINISAQSPNGANVVGSISIGSGSVDMILETDGYVHPFFKGKISPRYQNAVKITAIPHLGNASGGEYDPKTLVYTWKKNDKVLQDQSGYGKQSIILTGDIVPRPYDVTVSVAARDSGSQSEGNISIAAGSPSVSFYVDDPLYGPLWNRALGGTVSIGSEKETGVLVVPFGFNKPVGDVGYLTFTWLINSFKRAELAANESVVLRAPEGSAGTSNIRLDIRNTDRILQGASGGFSARFSGDAEKSGIDDVAF